MSTDTPQGPGAARPALGQELWPDRLARLLVSAMGVIEHYSLDGVSAEEAAALAADIVLAIADDSGGFSFYLPHGYRVRAALRRQQVALAAKAGASAGAIAKRFGLEVKTVKAMLTAERQRRAALRPRAPTREQQAGRGRRKVYAGSLTLRRDRQGHLKLD